MDIFTQPKGTYAFGPFRLDPVRRSLSRSGAPVKLGARLFETLLYLVENHDRLVERDELHQAVWRGRSVEECNLGQAISGLRKELQAGAPGENYIVTVAGRGYRFAVPVEFEPAPANVPAVAPVEPTDSRKDAAERLTHGRARRLLLAGLLAGVVAAMWRFTTAPGLTSKVAETAIAPPLHSVAVLAFTNLTGDPSQDYLSDGLSEELIESLSQIRQVQVTARTSSFFFKGKPSTIKDIAQTLNVAAVVEGSMRRQGNRLRIEARLTDAATGFQLWSHPFDSDLGDMLKLESDIAAQVADALQVKLAAGDMPEGGAGGTASAQALDAYLRGMHSIRHDSLQSYRAALTDFDAAVDADRNFALAYAGEANALTMIANNEDNPGPDEHMFSRALSAASRGLQLAPGNGLTHIALANILVNRLNLRGAWAEAERAEALTPGDATVDLLFSFIALSVGKREAAMRAARRAIALDPLREDGWLNLGQQYRVARAYDDAFNAYQHAQTLAGSETPLIAYERALAYVSMGNPQRALDIGLRGSDWTHMSCRAIALHMLGRQHDAEQTFAALLRKEGYNFDYVYAEIFAQWLQPAEAFRWLTRAKEANDSGLSIIRFDPMMDPIRQDPGFKAIEGSITFPD